MIELIQTILLIILVDRQLILRDRHKLKFEYNKPVELYDKTIPAEINVYLMLKVQDSYTRHKRLFRFILPAGNRKTKDNSGK